MSIKYVFNPFTGKFDGYDGSDRLNAIDVT